MRVRSKLIKHDIKVGFCRASGIEVVLDHRIANMCSGCAMNICVRIVMSYELVNESEI